jgi:hypothetical protein
MNLDSISGSDLAFLILVAIITAGIVACRLLNTVRDMWEARCGAIHRTEGPDDTGHQT